MTNSVKISVIIPVYDVEAYLRECLDSVINQTLKDIEIILIDDGGKDNCPAIIDEYAARDSRIKAIHKPNGGYGQTCNIGLEKATGEYVAIVEPDDFIDSDMYEKLYSIAKKFDSDIVKSCFYDNFDTPKIQKKVKTNWQDYIPEDRSFTIKEYPYFLQYHPSIWSCIYKREFLNKHNIKFVEAAGAGWVDNPFQVETMCLAERINYTSACYYYWRKVHESESEALNDISLPFKRSEEIHNWLKEKNIKDAGILSNLYRRELNYIGLIFDKKNLKKSDINFDEIDKLMSEFDDGILNSKNYIPTRAAAKMKALKKDSKKYYDKYKQRKIRKNLLSIHWNKKEKSIKLLGKCWRIDGQTV